jgi:hypothetical protein
MNKIKELIKQLEEKQKELFQKTIKRIDFVSGVIVIRLEDELENGKNY